ncbi:MAG: pyruvate dehydrogenase complex E1 component subunit beta [Rhodobacteraceae bacterium]|nr:pyruvate dehydrogenase complex E1 component subunit beta [Paracoccaceae bacterium]
MGSKILLPALSPTMEVGKIAKWFVKEGDTVASGDILAEIETDKAIMEFEAISDGEVEKLLVAENDEPIPVNSPIAIISGDDDASGEEETSSEENVSIGLKETATVSAVPEAPREKLKEDLSLKNVSFKSQTVREALRDAMAEEMERDELVFLMGEEVAEYQGAYKVSQGLLDQFGSERVIDTPITEHGFTGLGVGAGFAGLRPIVEFMTFNFAMQAIDHIINSAGKTLYMSGGQMNCPIVFRGPNGAAARVAAQHSQDYAAWYSHIPGLKVIQPYSAADAKGLLKSAIRDPNPVVFLENEILYNRSFDVPELDEYTVPIGKAKIWKEGKDVTLVSFGIGMSHTLEAARELESIGVDAEIIDLRTLRPLDKDTVIESVKKTNRCVTIEEGFPVCSIGNHLSYLIMQEAFDWLDAPVICCTGKDVPMPYAANLEKLALVSVPEIVQAAKSVLYLEE